MKELKNKTVGQSFNNSRSFTCISNSIVFLFYMLLFSCNPIVKTIGPFSSPNVEESKSRDAFLWEYYPICTKINDAIDDFDIKEVFAEKQYSYYSYNDLRYKISNDKFQVIIVAKKKLSYLKHFKSWVLEDFSSVSPYSLKKDYNQTNPPDSLLTKILKVDINENGGAGKDDKRVIGSFVLHRKWKF